MKKYLLVLGFLLLFLQPSLFSCGFFTSCFQWEYKPPKVVDFYFAHTMNLFSTHEGVSEINVGGMIHIDGKSSNKSTANTILFYLTGIYDTLPIFFTPNNPFGYRTGELIKPWIFDFDLNLQYPLVSLNVESRLLLASIDKVKILGFLKALFGYSYENYEISVKYRKYRKAFGNIGYLWWEREYHPEVQLGIIFENTNHNDVRLGFKLKSTNVLFLDFIHRY